jgi:hypothetical protein
MKKTTRRKSAQTAKATSKTKSAATPMKTDWREKTLAKMRAMILAADPGITEDRKWKKASNPAGVLVWSHDGMICTGEKYKEAVKLTFARGASLPDPSRLFNASLEGNARRAIDIREGETVNARAFRALVKSAVKLNVSKKK